MLFTRDREAFFGLYDSKLYKLSDNFLLSNVDFKSFIESARYVSETVF